MSLFRTKNFDHMVAHAGSPGGLKKVLGTFDLILMGIGAIVGTGIFVLTGTGALTAGPALTLSFIVAAIGFAGHTHGAPVATHSGRPIKRPSGPYSSQYVHGRFEIEGRGTLFVSRGIGCAGIPLRVHADPELLICTLR